MGLINSKSLITMGAGVTTGLFYYIFFGSNKKLRLAPRRVKPIMGLKNVGATCFLNSVLQALASCSHLVEWLANKDDFNRAEFPPCIPDSYARLQYPIIAVLYRALLVINRDIGGEERDDYRFMDKVPGDIIGTLRQQGHRFRTSEEQDTFEFYQFLLGTLAKEVEKSVRRQQIGSLDCILDEEDTSEVSGELISSAEIDNFSLDPPSSSSAYDILPEDIVSSGGWSVVIDPNDPLKYISQIFSTRKVNVDISYKTASSSPFTGLTSSQLKCLACMSKTTLRVEAFDSLTLMIPDNIIEDKLLGIGASRVLTVYQLLDNYFKPTIVTQVDCEGCSKTQKQQTKSAFSKTMYMQRLPPTLCLHILRASWSTSGILSKRWESVSFPEILDLSRLKRHADEYKRMVLQQGGDIGDNGNEAQLRRFRDSQYRLVAVISHVGDPECGHFITFRRGPSKFKFHGLEKSADWFCVSDEHVELVTLAEVRATRAYMLFYEKVTAK